MAEIIQLNSKRAPGLSASAAELRLALHRVRELVKQGRTSGEEWRAADIRQRNATHAWRLALRQVSTPLSLLGSTSQPHAKLGVSHE
jgi:hypothetical protein